MRDIAPFLMQETYTRPDLDRRIGLLRASLEHVLYHADEKPEGFSRKEAVLGTALSESQHERDVAVLETWYESVWKDVDAHTLPSFLAELEESAHTLRELQLYVPIAFSEETLAPLALWYRKNINPHTLFVLHINPAVVGGCGFVAFDTYHEYSLRTRMKEHEGLITKLITSYA